MRRSLRHTRTNVSSRAERVPEVKTLLGYRQVIIRP